MTNQEAIEKFKKIKRGNIFLIHQRIEGKEVIEDFSLCDMAISALKKQIPKKPEKSKVPRYGMGYEYYDWYCPTCERFLAFEPSKGDHHCYCGQAIDWEEE